MRSRLFSTLTMVALLAGCTVGPDYQPPHLSAPERWTEGNADAPHVARADSWWDGFHDPILSDLLQKAVSGNKGSCPSMRWKFGVELERPSVRRPEVELL